MRDARRSGENGPVMRRTLGSVSRVEPAASSAAFALLSPPPLESPRTRRSERRLHRDAGPPPERGGGDDPHDGGRGGGGGGDSGGSTPDAPKTPAGAADLAFGFLLVAVCTLFLAFLLAWVLLRRSAAWPSPELRRPPSGLWASTLLLLASELSMGRTARARRPQIARRWVVRAALFGALFLAAQAWLWRELLLRGVTTASDAYGALFYSLTGLHALHVVGGLAYMTLLVHRLGRAVRAGGASRIAGIRLCRIYWHLMGAIWVVLFLVLYFGS